METLWQMEANIDDMNPQHLEYVFSRLLESGVNDVWAVPMLMKKGRLAVMLGVLCKKALLEEVEAIIFTETTSIGVRHFPVERKACERFFGEVTVDGERIGCKICSHNGCVTTISAEYDDCRRAAEKSGKPLKEWQRRAKEEAYKIYG